ncbi:hypothetical protein K431DRAFT_345448 [Polychaeton citri CBS 116435]|uniref:DUF1772-domain-containing protein n=1 Tax=Polychaeton citri CBS 116435 TaxID=1314669 RepID=A0A9P4QD45_9PEZI|nr:hypothetical protein K431DRAFT_345448 [Polychaeton citri CBS 116435]
MAALIKIVQTASITVSLLASGSIATMSLFDIPEIKSQPASRSLPMTRWLFSRGSHIIPPMAVFSAAGFSFLAFNALPQSRALSAILTLGGNGLKANGYLLAALLNIAIAPWTQMVMVPTNFAIIKMNEELGGTRSAESANLRKGIKREQQQSYSAEDSVNGKDQVDQFRDLSGPQTQTERDSTDEENKKAYQLLSKFEQLNYMRAALSAAGGILGLAIALA